jgi:serine/threonine protein kinase
MAPEQAAGQRPITHRVDIWALGAILYECLAGVRPIDGENFAEVVMKLRHATITPIEVLEPTLPGELSMLVGSMLSRDPTARPQDLREAVAVLSTYAKVSVPTFGPPDVDLVMATEALSRTRSVPPSARTQPGASGSTETAPVPTPNEVRAYRFRRGVTVAAVAAAVIGLLALVRSAH